MLKCCILFILISGSILWAGDNFVVHIQDVTAEFQQMEQRIAPKPSQIEATGVCLMPTGLPFRASVAETQDRFNWTLLPEYYYDYEVDSSGTTRFTTLKYHPIDDVFALLPALYGLWMSEPVNSLSEYKNNFIAAAKSTGGTSYTELINKSETFYNSIPGFNFCYKYRSGTSNLVWYTHLLWKDNIGYMTYFLCFESDYNSSLKRTYFTTVLILANFKGTSGVFSKNPVQLPENFVLDQNYPNPFNGSTIFQYQLRTAACPQLTIFNTLGQEIRHYSLENQMPGDYQIQWDGRNNHGEMVQSGIYFYRLQVDGGQMVKQMTLVK
ncbi:T9SS type A sorting domain-containing protein [candidate division KSB1 bacterium]|nr:T9SS type A sorting domain-containing protein [candidate division KSB1 bacterium]